MNKIPQVIKKIYYFYYEGFTTLSDWGKKVWLIIIIKLFIIFFILRLFFFPDYIKKNFSNDMDRSNYVREKLLSK